MSTSDCYDLNISVSSSNWRTDGSETVIDEVWDNAIISIYPNPAVSDNVTVNYFSVQEDSNVDIKIIDLLGRVVKTFEHPVTSGENMIGINISQLHSGFYSVVISNGKSNYTDKFIID